jgi:hypothetical protein
VELGQLLTNNKQWEEHDADWATYGLILISQVIAESRGKDPFGGWTTLTSNSGDEEFQNDVFYMSSYCWCEGMGEGHEEGCPPNFLYKPNGLQISWYKHAGRGIRANIEYPGSKNWAKAIMKCIESI